MSADNDTTKRNREGAWRHGLVVAAAAILVRALYLWQSAGGPFFAEPLVDASTYHNLARDLAVEGVFTEHFLWQAPLYPLFLAGLYGVFGVSVALARVAGALLGVATVLLTWRLGRRLLGERLGLAVGLATALNGVLIYFESELLATGLTTSWVVVLISLALDLAARPRPALGLVLGAAGALAVLTRPVLLAPLLVLLAWIFWPRKKVSVRSFEQTKARSAPAVSALAVVLGAALVLGPFAAITSHHTGRLGLWPPSGAINAYIGNHPDFPSTLIIRPGLPWEALIAQPIKETGINDPWVNSRWYRDKTLGFIREQPGAWLAGLGQKGLHLLSGRELPRNVDLYAQRAWSTVLGVLLWKAGPFGFPAGVLLPLAMLGLWVARRRLPGAVPLFIMSYAAILVLVFVSSRYRAPLWPLLTLAAVAGAVELWRGLRAGLPGLSSWLTAWMGSRLRSRSGAPRPPLQSMVALGCLLGLVVLSTAFGPFVPEQVEMTAELWHGVGFNQLRRDEPALAAASFRLALAARGDYPEALNRLGVALAMQDSFAAAIPHFERAYVLDAGYVEAGRNLERARGRAAYARFVAAQQHERQARDAEAIAAYRQALAFQPGWPQALARLAWLLATSDLVHLRDGTEALALARAALANSQQEHPWLHEVLAAAERQAAREKRERAEQSMDTERLETGGQR